MSTRPQPTILIVDDDNGICELLRAVLKEEGYAVDVAHNGVAALEYLDKALPSLMVLDLMMPIMGGEDVLVEMRHRGITIPVIVASAKSRSDVIAAAAGADAYTAKPFDIDDLCGTVSRLLDGARSEVNSG